MKKEPFAALREPHQAGGGFFIRGVCERPLIWKATDVELCLWPGQGEIDNRNLYILIIIYILFLFNKKK